MNLEAAKIQYEAERVGTNNRHHWDSLPQRIQERYRRLYEIGTPVTSEQVREVALMALDELQIIQGHLEKAFPASK